MALERDQEGPAKQLTKRDEESESEITHGYYTLRGKNKGELGKTEKFEKIKNEASREADSGLDADRSQLKHNTPSLTL